MSRPDSLPDSDVHRIPFASATGAGTTCSSQRAAVVVEELGARTSASSLAGTCRKQFDATLLTSAASDEARWGRLREEIEAIKAAERLDLQLAAAAEETAVAEEAVAEQARLRHQQLEGEASIASITSAVVAAEVKRDAVLARLNSKRRVFAEEEAALAEEGVLSIASLAACDASVEAGAEAAARVSGQLEIELRLACERAEAAELRAEMVEYSMDAHKEVSALHDNIASRREAHAQALDALISREKDAAQASEERVAAAENCVVACRDECEKAQAAELEAVAAAEAEVSAAGATEETLVERGAAQAAAEEEAAAWRVLAAEMYVKGQATRAAAAVQDAAAAQARTCEEVKAAQAARMRAQAIQLTDMLTQKETKMRIERSEELVGRVEEQRQGQEETMEIHAQLEAQAHLERAHALAIDALTAQSAICERAQEHAREAEELRRVADQAQAESKAMAAQSELEDEACRHIELETSKALEQTMASEREAENAAASAAQHIVAEMESVRDEEHHEVLVHALSFQEATSLRLVAEQRTEEKARQELEEERCGEEAVLEARKTGRERVDAAKARADAAERAMSAARPSYERSAAAFAHDGGTCTPGTEAPLPIMPTTPLPPRTPSITTPTRLRLVATPQPRLRGTSTGT
eukprot:TRINITY_DN6147_c0_g1_i1.p1 TRINITY_DN6147_c0_g1~~TRINITY_DN6147_c0_g1_i1.p1  ORF type:complete len:738 (-),score=163.40 TRINITY_DN6147_c0_g1_i1:331-2265(-)